MRRLYNAFFYSLDGLSRAFRTESAVRQECFLLLLSALAAAWVASDLASYALLVGVIVILIAIELLNTAIEKLADHVRPERHEDIKYVKDLGSAAVLCAIVFAALVWGVALYSAFLG
jgi:diacylglycerol kinase (ATP)